MKPKIYRYDYGASYLAVIKNGYIVDIACSDKNYESAGMYSEESCVSKRDLFIEFGETVTKIQFKDLALYTHWPRHTKEFWDLLNET
jgi:hypothetical protein